MIKINLQIFGGRGAGGIGGSSGISPTTSAYTVKNGNNTVEWYFSKSGDTNYYRNTINGQPEPTPNNWSPKEMIDRVKENGGTVEKKTTAQLKKEVKKYQKEKAEMNDFLNREYARNRDADSVHKAYRNYKRAQRLSRRG